MGILTRLVLKQVHDLKDVAKAKTSALERDQHSEYIYIFVISMAGFVRVHTHPLYRLITFFFILLLQLHSPSPCRLLHLLYIFSPRPLPSSLVQHLASVEYLFCWVIPIYVYIYTYICIYIYTDECLQHAPLQVSAWHLLLLMIHSSEHELYVFNLAPASVYTHFFAKDTRVCISCV